jgi:hypothetical protein
MRKMIDLDSVGKMRFEIKKVPRSRFSNSTIEFYLKDGNILELLLDETLVENDKQYELKLNRPIVGMLLGFPGPKFKPIFKNSH